MTLSDPNPGFKVTGYLKVEYLADGARVFIVQSTVVDHQGLYRKGAKNGVVAEFFFVKSAERWKLSLTELVFVETSTQTYSLSEEDFAYNYGRLKSSASHACR